MTRRSDIPAPMFKHENRFYHVRKWDLFETLQGFANNALLVGHERLFGFADGIVLTSSPTAIVVTSLHPRAAPCDPLMRSLPAGRPH
jgi:hypothetical protein